MTSNVYWSAYVDICVVIVAFFVLLAVFAGIWYCTQHCSRLNKDQEFNSDTNYSTMQEKSAVITVIEEKLNEQQGNDVKTTEKTAILTRVEADDVTAIKSIKSDTIAGEHLSPSTKALTEEPLTEKGTVANEERIVRILL